MLFLDTNIIVYYLHGIEPYATIIETYLQSEELVTSLRVIDEALFTLVRMKAWRDLGIKRIEDLRKYRESRGYRDFEGVISALSEFIERLSVEILRDEGSYKELVEVATRYNLMPSDALIAITCRRYGINTIATFDEDFKRVPWLRVVPRTPALPDAPLR